LLHWSVQDSLYRVQQAFEGLLDNFPGSAVAARLLRFMVFPLGTAFSPPSDNLSHEVASLMLSPGEARDRLTGGIFIPDSADEPLSILEQALQCAVVCEAVEAKLRAAVKAGRIPAEGEAKIAAALKQRVITPNELELMAGMTSLRRRVVMVDDFPPDFGTVSPPVPDSAPAAAPAPADA
jgi:acyl-CoA dehydrogenase